MAAVAGLSPGLIRQAQDVYERLRPTIEKKFQGQFIAIDPISKEYFIAPGLAGALTQAMAKLPGREFYTTKIGAASAISFS